MHVGRRVSRMQATRGRHGPALLVPVSAVAVTVRDGVGEYVAPCLRLFVLPAGTRVHRMGRRAWCGLQCCGGGHGRVRALLVMAWGGRGWLQPEYWGQSAGRLGQGKLAGQVTLCRGLTGRGAFERRGRQ